MCCNEKPVPGKQPIARLVLTFLDECTVFCKIEKNFARVEV